MLAGFDSLGTRQAAALRAVLAALLLGCVAGCFDGPTGSHRTEADPSAASVDADQGSDAAPSGADSSEAAGPDGHPEPEPAQPDPGHDATADTGGWPAAVEEPVVEAPAHAPDSAAPGDHGDGASSGADGSGIAPAGPARGERPSGAIARERPTTTRSPGTTIANGDGHSAGAGAGGLPVDAAVLPDYPWPPEDPSSLARLDSVYDFSRAGTASLFDVAEALRNALHLSGYPELSYYRAPGGFAMVTRLEGIDDEGRPLGPERRYRLPNDRGSFSLGEYISGLFFAPEGLYRLIVFVVSDVPYTTVDRPLDEAVAVTRLRRGAVALPAAYRTLPYSARHRVDALIYEFRAAAAQVETLRPGRLPPTTHIERTGLLPNLDD